MKRLCLLFLLITNQTSCFSSYFLPTGFSTLSTAGYLVVALENRPFPCEKNVTDWAKGEEFLFDGVLMYKLSPCRMIKIPGTFYTTPVAPPGMTSLAGVDYTTNRRSFLVAAREDQAAGHDAIHTAMIKYICDNVERDPCLIS